MPSRSRRAVRATGRLATGTAKRALLALSYGLAGALVILVAVGAAALNSRPDLKVWHTADLDAEFTAESPVRSLGEYLELEERLFAELDREVCDRIDPEDTHSINRYHRGSLADPGIWPRNWNRTFELAVDDPAAGVLLLHGMSDSPYSLRRLGGSLHDAGAWVVGLRLPGHGTAPSGLVTAEWEDMAAAVRLAMARIAEKAAGRPLFIVGYSNGGALAVEYALSRLEDSSFPAVEGLILVSPAVGVSPVAAFAVWQGRLGRILGLRKLAWNSILPEYDPFKYGSFAVNAGHQVYRLTKEIRARLQRLGGAGRLTRFPPVLAFQSAVDATVSTPALVEVLFRGLPEGGHELVLFDINRIAGIEHLLTSDPGPGIESLLADADATFTFSLVTKRGAGDREVVVRSRRPGERRLEVTETDLRWPKGVYSLSHVALPFREDDPVYGRSPPQESPGIRLGDIAYRGEKGVLRVSGDERLRLRWNPFYGYLQGRLLGFVGLQGRPRY